MAGTLHHFTNASGSVVDPSGNAFADAGPGTAIIDIDAYIISLSAGDGMNLGGAWDITLNGVVGAYGSTNSGIRLTSASLTDTSNITIGANGNIFGGAFGIFSSHKTNVTNKGLITGNDIALVAVGGGKIVNSGMIANFDTTGAGLHVDGNNTIINSGIILGPQSINGSNAVETITNYGSLIGFIDLFMGDDILTNFKKVGGVTKHGIISSTIDMGIGDDTFSGGNKSETLRDGPGADTAKFGGGNDVYLAIKLNMAVDGTDTVDGGAGIDTFDADNGTNSININIDAIAHFALAAGTASGTDIGALDKVTGFENVTGGSNADVIYGSSAANVLNGQGGGDTLRGFGGNDTLIGDAGVDFLYGGAGKDTLTGGDDADTFRFSAISESGKAKTTRDLITDFSGTGGEGDKIDLSAIDANGALAGDPTFAFIGLDSFNQVAGELRSSMTAGGTIVQGDVNGDGKADFSIALTGNILLQAGDFNL